MVVMSALPGPFDPPVPVTVSVAELEISPVKPGMVAVIVVVPAESPVATPEALMVATAGALDVQVTVSVTLLVEDG